ncbi:CDC42 [Lepeophtheirus salmonis]|uniref:CDC42 n=1 Tax=Lepeophtheirus salmonis TaxID=72036 RepID=A0A7R8H6C5_LEPSM|nr:CDC42 [Lepeophtheirus salmonis]CAF2885968.1 CDC42 [Lepeophtheirus salmonis]
MTNEYQRRQALAKQRKASKSIEYKKVFRNTQKGLKNNFKLVAKAIVEGPFDPVGQWTNMDPTILHEWKSIFEKESINGERSQPDCNKYGGPDALKIMNPITKYKLNRALPLCRAGKYLFGYKGAGVRNLDQRELLKHLSSKLGSGMTDKSVLKARTTSIPKIENTKKCVGLHTYLHLITYCTCIIPVD